MYDNLHHSRIIVGEQPERAECFALILAERTIKKTMEMLNSDPVEAKAIKLISNTFLALRVSFFNVLDTMLK